MKQKLLSIVGPTAVGKTALSIELAKRYQGASGDDLKYLEVEEGSPILELEQLVWLSNGKMIEYSTSRNPGNLRSYTALNVNNF